MGLALALIFWVVPPFCLRISFNLFFLACKEKARCCRRCSFSGCACYSFSIILRTLGRRVKRAGAACTVLTILTVPIKFFCGSVVSSKKPVLSMVFGVFVPVFSSCFGTQLSHVQYTIIARVVYKIRTVGTQKLHVLLWLYVYAYNAFTVFGYCVAFYKLFIFPIIKYGRRIVPYTSFFGFGGVWLSGCLKYLFK